MTVGRRLMTHSDLFQGCCCSMRQYAARETLVSTRSTAVHVTGRGRDAARSDSIAAGYDSWNAYIHYVLNPVFDGTAILDGKRLDFRIFKVGIMFYLL